MGLDQISEGEGLLLAGVAAARYLLLLRAMPPLPPACAPRHRRRPRACAAAACCFACRRPWGPMELRGRRCGCAQRAASVGEARGLRERECARGCRGRDPPSLLLLLLPPGCRRRERQRGIPGARARARCAHNSREGTLRQVKERGAGVRLGPSSLLAGLEGRSTSTSTSHLHLSSKPCLRKRRTPRSRAARAAATIAID